MTKKSGSRGTYTEPRDSTPTAIDKPEATKSVTHQDEHEECYGENRHRLTPGRLHDMAKQIVNGSHETACNLILLMDEIERSQFDRLELSYITNVVSNAAMPFTLEYSRTRDALLDALRQNVETEGESE